MKNLKIRTKLLITFMAIIVLFCVTVLGAITGLRSSAEKYTEFYTVGYQITNKAMSMRRSMQIIVKNLSFITIEDEAAKKETYLTNLRNEITLLEDNSDWLNKKFEGDHELLNSITDGMSDVLDMQETIINTANTDKVKAQAMLLDEYQPLVDQVVAELIQMSDVAEADAKADYDSTTVMQQRTVYILFGIAIAALLITLLLSAYLTSAITRPLHKLRESANNIVEGHFDITIDYESRDELGNLADAFRNMTSILNSIISDASRLLSEMANGNFDVRTEAEEHYVGNFQNLLSSIRKLNRDLSITLGRINQSADQVASGSDQVSNGSQALSQGATEQAAAVQQLAATITDISNQIKDTADNASEARNESNIAGNEVEKCNAQMKEMVAAMEEISNTSDEIGKIIKTIEDIAFQTNILALNAAVEASRAGTAGKGFAVVADEVRELAGKSSEASKNTAELIESSLQAVARGKQIADSTAQTLVNVVNVVSKTSTKVKNIADAAEEQAGSVQQVTVGVDQISTVVQNNSSTAQESASASQILSGQAAMLKNLVAKFTLRQDYIQEAFSQETYNSGMYNSGMYNSGTNFGSPRLTMNNNINLD